MSRARNLADLLDANGDVSSSALDNVEALPDQTDNSGKYLTTDGTDASWNTITPVFGSIIAVTSDKTLTSADNGSVISVDSAAKITLPATEEGLVFGIINATDSKIILSAPSSSTYIGLYQEKVFLESLSEFIIACDGTDWKIIGDSGTITIVVRHFTASGTYTPDADVQSFLACLTGATGGGGVEAGGADGNRSASGGGGYAEKFYASPSGSYSFVIGSGGGEETAGGTSTFNSTDISISGATQSPDENTGGTGATPTGSSLNYSASGGNGANSVSIASGGGGAGSRGGNGGDGSEDASGNCGSGGGQAENDASGLTPGAAATADSVTAYTISGFVFSSGTAGSQGGGGSSGFGGDGAPSLITYDLADGTQVTIGDDTAGKGAGGFRSNGPAGSSGYRGELTIVEFY